MPRIKRFTEYSAQLIARILTVRPSYVLYRWVATDMTNNNGLIDTKTSAAGLLSQLESDKVLNGKWYGWNNEEIPW